MTDQTRLQELRTMPYQAYLQTPEWQAKREQTLELANHRCQLCYSPDDLNVHHRTYERRGHEELSDLTVLCKSCHSLFHDRVPAQEQEHSFHSISSIAAEYWQQFDIGTSSRGIRIGYKDLDFTFRKSDLILLGGRTSLGKTSLALNIGLNTSLASNSVAIFSLEMNKQQLFNRLLAMHSKIDLQWIQSNDITSAERQRVLEAADTIGNLPIWISDEVTTVDSMRNKLHNLIASSNKVDLVIVDYIRLVEPDRYTKRLNSEQQIRAISRGLKLLAREFDIPVLVLCQLSREADKRAPVLSDLRDSGAQEEDADIVLLMHADGEEMHDQDLGHINLVNVMIAKHRNGPIGVSSLVFFKNTTLFRDLDPIPEK